MLQQTLQYLLSEIIISNVLVAFPKKGRETSKLSQNKAIKHALDSFLLNAKKK